MSNRSAWTIFLAAGVAACGGGSGDPEPDPQETAGIDARGAPRADVATKGKISGFGSVIVNGVRYDTSNANFDIEDQPGSEADLAVGQVVTILGSTDDTGEDARADTIIYDDLVEGPVTSVDTGANTLIVLGQTVRIDSDTIFDDDFSPRAIAGVVTGQIVEVSGFRDSAGAIRATYIDIDDDADDLDLVGTVSNVDTSTFRFQVAALVIDYSNASLDDFPAGGPENGQSVEVEGTLDSNGVLLATEVSFAESLLSDSEGDDVEIEGFVTRFVSATDFDVDGTPVTTTDQTSFSDGTVDDLALDVAVEIDGEFDANGVIVADSVEFEREGELELSGTVEAISDSSITLLGITANITAKTDLIDSSSNDLSRFSLADISVGDFVEVRGFESGNGLTLTGVERDDDDGESGLVGPVSSVSQPDFVAVGVTVRTSAATEFEDESDNDIDAATFFDSAPGRVVEVSGMYGGGILNAEEVELEDDDSGSGDDDSDSGDDDSGSGDDDSDSGDDDSGSGDDDSGSGDDDSDSGDDEEDAEGDD